MSEKKRDLYRKLKIAKEVEQVTKNTAWNEVMEPWLNKAIQECVGGKDTCEKGLPRWRGGQVQLYSDEGKTRYFMARKQALMDFYNMIYNYVRSAEGLKNQIKKMEAQETASETLPTMSRTNYGKGYQESQP